jgi:hypothetical protein
MMLVLPVQVVSDCPECLPCTLLSFAKNLFERASFGPRPSTIRTTPRQPNMNGQCGVGYS